jgi:acetyl/propionyl-CoA carboxylase alpha subunit
MGSKLESKRLMEQAGIPTLNAIDVTGLDHDTLAKAAEEIGYPVLVKASAGGGGKGMRIVPSPDGLSEAVESARREAAGAFGDDTLFIERYLDSPRHIEIQVFADRHGNTVSLFERECSIQRRHQKIIEEAPSPAIDEETRRRMGEAATAAARAVGYVGAGTVEFLYQDGEFFFLEMNTRLQVEHPVTELITGLDLVRLQLLVAMGEPLPPEATGARIRGHAIEARLYAEDPANGFLPVTGHLAEFQFPYGTGLRVDSGVERGSEVTAHYDPMLAKVIAWAPTREEAARVLASGLERARIHGLVTNRNLLVRVLRHPDFIAGNTDTHFLERHDPVELSRPFGTTEEERRAALAAALAIQAANRRDAKVLGTLPSGWRNVPSQPQAVRFRGEQIDEIEIRYMFDRRGALTAEGFPAVRPLEVTPERVTVEVDGMLEAYDVARYGDDVYLDGPAGPMRLAVMPRFHEYETEEDPGSLHAPMPGKVVRVEVTEGQAVSEGQVLVVMEAMKMEHALRAPHAGVVTEVRARDGDQVAANEILVVVGEP